MSRIGVEAKFIAEQTFTNRTNTSMALAALFEGVSIYALSSHNLTSPDIGVGLASALLGVYAWQDALRASLPSSINFNIRNIAKRKVPSRSLT